MTGMQIDRNPAMFRPEGASGIQGREVHNAALLSNPHQNPSGNGASHVVPRQSKNHTSECIGKGLQEEHRQGRGLTSFDLQSATGRVPLSLHTCTCASGLCRLSNSLRHGTVLVCMHHDQQPESQPELTFPRLEISRSEDHLKFSEQLVQHLPHSRLPNIDATAHAAHTLLYPGPA